MRIFRWTLKDELITLMIWSTIIAIFIVMVVALYPVVGDLMSKYLMASDFLLGMLGQKGTSLVPFINAGNNFDIWLTMEFFSWMSLTIGFYVLIFAASHIAGETEKQSMELLLAQPVSRTRVMSSKFAVVLVNVTIILMITFLALFISWLLLIEDKAKFDLYFYIFLNNYFLLFAFSGISFFISSLLNEQRKVTGILIGILVMSYFINMVINMAGQVRWLGKISLFYYADASKILTSGKIDWSDNILLFIVGVVFLLLALMYFQRKDILV